jgi:hypothetical protein
MDLKKFINKTNKLETLITSYSFHGAYNILKVIEVLNYYTLKVIIWNNGIFNTWVLKLVDVDLMDHKMVSKNRDFFKRNLEMLCINQFFVFSLNGNCPNNLNILKATIFPLKINKKQTKYNKSILSVNTTMINSIINLCILIDKIKKNKSLLNNFNDQFYTLYYKQIPRKLSYKPNLETILEEQKL